MTALGAVGVRVADDAFLQRAHGVAVGDHLLSGVVPLTCLAVAAWVVCHSSGALRGLVLLLAGLFGVVGGMELFVETGATAGGVQSDDLTGALSIAGGVVLVAASFHSIWTTPRRRGSAAAHTARRGVVTLGVWVSATVIVFPVGLGYFATHASGPGLTSAPDVGARVSKVGFESSDGLDLTGWYVPSSNGAAVIVVPGRSGVDHARLLAEHGYGVLLLNRRGEGDSEGDPNLFGWGGQGDIDGAIDFLSARPDVASGAVGALGLSVGGEVLLEHAATSDGLAAVVSEGAGSRSIRETLELSGGIRWAELTTAPLLTGSLVVWSDRAPPPNLVEALAGLEPTPALVVWGEEGQPAEIKLGRRYAEAAGAASTAWEVPGAGHTQGLDTAPDEYERVVIGFLDRHLLHGSHGG
jgi:dienelactone hydrolase